MKKRDFITFWEEVHTIIDDAVEKRDRMVSVYFHPETGFSVNVYPWPDADELYEQYKKRTDHGKRLPCKNGSSDGQEC